MRCPTALSTHEGFPNAIPPPALRRGHRPRHWLAVSRAAKEHNKAHGKGEVRTVGGAARHAGKRERGITGSAACLR